MSVLAPFEKYGTLFAVAYALYKSSPLYYGWVRSRLIFFALLGLVAAVVSGLIGREFGLVDLFWGVGPGSLFLAGLSVGGLAILLFWMSFVLSPAGRISSDRVDHALAWAHPWPVAVTATITPKPPDALFRGWLTAMFLPIGLALFLPLAGWNLPSSGPGRWLAPKSPLALPFGAWTAWTIAWLPLFFPNARSFAVRAWPLATVSIIVLAAIWSLACHDLSSRLVTVPVALCWTLAVASLGWFLTDSHLVGNPHRSALVRGFLAVVLLLGVAFCNGGDPFKLQYPGLEAEYPDRDAIDRGHHELVSIAPPRHPLDDRTTEDHVIPGNPALDRRIDAAPSDPSLLLVRGLDRLRAGDVDGALDDLQKARELDSTGTEVASSLGAALCLDGRAGEALACLDAAIALGSDSAALHCNRATALSQLKRWDEAIAAYDRSLEERGGARTSRVTRARVKLLQGIAYRRNGDDDRATENFQVAENLDGASSFGSYYMGELLEDKGEIEAAVQAYDRAISADPAFAPLAYIAKMEVLHGLGQHQEEVVAGQAAHETAQIPSDVVGRLIVSFPDPAGGPIVLPQIRALVLVARSGLPSAESFDLNQAFRDLDRALACDPGNPLPLIVRASIEIGLENWPAALNTCNRALELDPESLDALATRGQVNGGMGKFDDAIQDLKQVVERDQSDVAAYSYLGRAYLFRFDQSVSSSRFASEGNAPSPVTINSSTPDNPGPEITADLEAALQAFDKALELNPGAAQCYAQHASFYGKLHDLPFPHNILKPDENALERATKLIDRAIDLDPFNPSYYRMLASVHLRRREQREMIAAIRQATRLQQRWSDTLDLRAPIRVVPPGRLDDRTTLEAWLGRVRPNPESPKPTLIVVAASGGGIAAAYWTALCLSEIERQCPAFPAHVRMITGSSGGMLGATSYVAALATSLGADLDQDPDLKRHVVSLPALFSDRLKQVPEAMGRESLTPVVRRMLLFDLPSILCPKRQTKDRGRTLDETWIANTGGILGWPLSALSASEGRGRLPSLVITPMTEKGTFLLISNLDLDSRAGGRDFFTLFPGSRPTLRLATAVRMNANFPIVAPAVSLPAAGAPRLGDSGYLDNHGVWLSSEWLWNNRGWLVARTGGVVLLQIRAYPATSDEEPPERSDRFRLGTQWLTTPFEMAMGGRYAMMNTRNDEAIQKLNQHFNVNDDKPFFHHVVLESSYAQVPLSWSLTAADRGRLDAALHADEDPLREGVDQAGLTPNRNQVQIQRLVSLISCP